MPAFATLVALAAAAFTTFLAVRIVVMRVDDACRLAELVRNTRALRARHRAAAPAPRLRRR
jgi:hypothetical protein